MSTIAQVMQSTAIQYKAVHTLVDQSTYPKEQVGKGVCHALCKVWLKKFNPLYHPEEFEKSINLDKVVLKQQKAMDNRYKSIRLQDIDGELGGLSIHILTIQRMAETRVREIHTATVGRGRSLSTPTMRANAPVTVSGPVFSEPFWEKCGEAMTPSPDADFDRRLITLKYGGDDDHVVASHRNSTDRHYRFFDPNGGIMDFGEGISAWSMMQEWLQKELKTATASKYNNMQFVQVQKFYPKGV